MDFLEECGRLLFLSELPPILGPTGGGRADRLRQGPRWRRTLSTRKRDQGHRDKLLSRRLPGSGTGLTDKTRPNTLLFSWISHADNAAGDTATSIASGLFTGIPLGMHDYASAQDGVPGAVNRNVCNGDFIVGFAVRAGLEVAQVARVALLGSRQAMLMPFRVVVSARAGGIRRRAVPILMDVNRMFLSGVQPLQVGNYFN